MEGYYTRRLKNAPGRLTGGTQKGLLTVATSQSWRGSGVSAAPGPPGRTPRIPQTGGIVNEAEGAFLIPPPCGLAIPLR